MRVVKFSQVTVAALINLVYAASPADFHISVRLHLWVPRFDRGRP